MLRATARKPDSLKVILTAPSTDLSTIFQFYGVSRFILAVGEIVPLTYRAMAERNLRERLRINLEVTKRLEKPLCRSRKMGAHSGEGKKQ